MAGSSRKVLLGHRNGDITSHYSAPEIEELLEAANRVGAVQSRTDAAEKKNGLENLSKPLIFIGNLVAGAGFEPTTFGL